jgi:phosphoglycerate dehydrogenase-like enzyme
MRSWPGSNDTIGTLVLLQQHQMDSGAAPPGALLDPTGPDRYPDGYLTSLSPVTATSLLVCYTGDRPPDWACDQAAELGVQFTPLGPGGAAVLRPEEAAERLALLRPAGYLMNHPCYGPYLSAELADAAGGSLRIVTYVGATREPGVYETFFDVTALRERGVVLTAPGVPSLAVAESALTLLFALELGLVPAHLAAKAGATGSERGIALGSRGGLLGSTLGVVGLGQVGQRVAQLASGCGMRVRYASRTRRPDLEDLLGIDYLPLPELAERSDHLTIHTPIGTTRGLVDDQVLARARGICLVNNTADPEIIEPRALLEAVHAGRVRRVAVEGRYPEPYQQALCDLGDDRVLLLPAYASWGNPPREQERTWQQQLETYRAFLAGRPSRDQLL